MIPAGDELQCEPGWKPLAKGGLRDFPACFVRAGAGGRRPGEGKGTPGKFYLNFYHSKNFTVGCPWFRPVSLALPGALIPRVIFVLEGWTSPSLNLSVLPCPALSCHVLPVFARLSMSRGCAQPATRYKLPKTLKCPAAPRGNHGTQLRGAISEAAGLH